MHRRNQLAAKRLGRGAGLRPVRRLSFENLESREVLASLAWSVGPNLPAPRAAATGILAPDEALLLLGGSTTGNATEVWKLSPDANVWTTAPEIDKALDAPGVVRAAGDQVLIYGGYDEGKSTEEGWTYDYFTGDNQNIGNLSRPRAGFAFAADAEGRAYAIGGLDTDEDEVLASAERYEPATDQWSPIADLPAPRQGAAGVSDPGGHIYVFGGSSLSGSGGISNTSYRYTIATGVWDAVSPMPVGTRNSAALWGGSGMVYVLGGLSAGGTESRVQVYDPSTDTWTFDTDLPQAVHSHSAAVDGLSRIVVVGGKNAAGDPVAAVYFSQRFDIPESAPIIGSTPVTSGSLDRFYTYDLDATGNPQPTYELVEAPGGMAIDPASGLISWQPVEGQVGPQTVVVRAENRAGQVEQSFIIEVLEDTIPPTAPTALMVDAVTTTSATLAWQAATDARGVSFYEVLEGRRCGWRGRNTCYSVVQTGIAETSTTLTGLAPLTSHKYVVRAVDAAGNRSANSNQVTVTTESAPTLRYYVNGVINGVVHAKANHLLSLQLTATANPAAMFLLESGPPTMTVDSATGILQWTPMAGDVGTQSATVSATNSVGTTQLTVPINVAADAPVLALTFNPNSGGARYALAESLFEMLVVDASHTPPMYELAVAPVGMTIDAISGLIQWTPTAADAGPTTVTVRATSSAGITEVSTTFETYFTASPTNIAVTNLTALHPTATWTPPAGVGSADIAGYTLQATARYRYGRAYRTQRITYDSPGTGTSLELSGLTSGREYSLVINAYNADGERGVPSTETVKFVPRPALPNVSWTVTNPGGSAIVAGQEVQVQFTNLTTDPITFAMVSGPAGMTIDPDTGLAVWTPSAAEIGPHTLTFRLTNSVGPRDVVVSLNVLFSGPVANVAAIRTGDTASVSWTAPTDNVVPIAGYQVTRHWVWSGRRRSSSVTVTGLSATLALVPYGAVWHQGVTITPIDTSGRLGASSPLTYYVDSP